MIKKITLTIVLCCMLVSCGKKADPEYKESKNNAEIQTIHTS
tara:strand:- start:1447 stop:1572 length:126 start_codon:yes stop_codon:yes gene_type:complete